MKLKDGFELEQDESGIYIARAVDSRAEEYPYAFQMGLSGGYLWHLLSEGDCTELDLNRKLAALYDTDVDEDQIAADVETFLNFLRQQNLLEE